MCIWCCTHVGYAVLCTDDVMYMLYMQCYVHMVFCTCCTSGIMYIWCFAHNCTCGVMCMWSCVNVVHVVLCARGVVYMSCM